jgi:P-type conjugative transfer protein TrbJ
MKNRTRQIRIDLFAASGLALCIAMSGPAAAFTVFDPWNYEENLLTAIRSLEEIQNQVKQLTNEAQMLTRMDLNLEQLGSSVGGDLKSSLGDIESLLKKADGIALSVTQTDSEMRTLFPSEYANALTGDESLKATKQRWDETLSAFKRSMSLQAKVIENTTEDGSVLSDLLSKSSTAVGNLQAQQAGNELLGLNVKQQLQLQTLIATEQRAQGLERARTLASEEEARLRFKSFVGDGEAYTK